MGDADGTTTFPGMPFKHNSARRHRIPRARYRVTNWREDEAGLRRRGDLTLWLDEAAVAGWSAPTRSTPGGQPIYSDLAIELVLTVRRRRPADITLFYLWKGTSLEPLSSSKDQRLATPIGVGTPRRFTLLRRAFYDRTCTRRRVRLPSEAGIQVTGNTACAVLRLTTAAVQANMQDDAAAFEAGFSSDGLVRRAARHHRLGRAGTHCGGPLPALSLPTSALSDTARAGGRRGDGTGASDAVSGRERRCGTLNLAGKAGTAFSPSLTDLEADLEKHLAGANPAERARFMVGLGLVRLDRSAWSSTGRAMSHRRSKASPIIAPRFVPIS